MTALEIPLERFLSEQFLAPFKDVLFCKVFAILPVWPWLHVYSQSIQAVSFKTQNHTAQLTETTSLSTLVIVYV